MTDDDSQTLIKLALKLQSDVFVASMTAGGVAWLISLVLATLLVLAGSRAGRLLRLSAKTLALAAAMLMFASAWATGSAGKALEVAESKGTVQRGTLLVALQWIAAILSFAHAWAVTSVADDVDAGKGRDVYHM